MAFLTFKMIFSDDDEDLGIKKEGSEGEITINTSHICAFNANDKEGTTIRMANGEIYPCPLSIKEFRKFMNKVEQIVKVEEIIGN